MLSFGVVSFAQMANETNEGTNTTDNTTDDSDGTNDTNTTDDFDNATNTDDDNDNQTTETNATDEDTNTTTNQTTVTEEEEMEEEDNQTTPIASNQTETEEESIASTSMNNQTQQTAQVTAQTQLNQSGCPPITAASENIAANLYVKEWYPKGPDYVFVCNATGFTPTNYTWFYGDGHKLLNIHNQNTYHVYDALGDYRVMCSATDGVHMANDSIDITVTSLERPLFPSQGNVTAAAASNMTNATGTTNATTTTSTNTTTSNNSTIVDQNATTLGNVRIMKHLCPQDIQSVDDLGEIEDAAGDDPVARFVATERACPVVVNPGDEPTPGAISGGNLDFSFSVRGSDNEVMDSDDAEFEQVQVCQNNVTDSNQTNTSPLCHDTSYYAFDDVMKGMVEITEAPAAGTRLGWVKFTPPQLNGNNDRASFVSMNNSMIRLNTLMDSDDEVMLHVYNFKNPLSTMNETNEIGTGNTTGTGNESEESNANQTTA